MCRAWICLRVDACATEDVGVSKPEEVLKKLAAGMVELSKDPEAFEFHLACALIIGERKGPLH